LKCLIDGNSNEALYAESPDKLEFNEERTRSLIETIDKIDNQTSKEEMLKRLRFVSLFQYVILRKFHFESYSEWI
jgi:hypothetical protein